MVDMILQFDRQVVQGCFLAQRLSPTIKPLKGNMCSAEDTNIGIHQEESKYLSVPWLGWVLELEGLDLVLKDVGERQQPPFPRFHASNLLHRALVVLTPVNVSDEVMVISLVFGVLQPFGIPQLTKCKE